MTTVFMLVVAMVDHGLFGFGVHAAHFASAAECTTAGSNLLKELKLENRTAFYNCYDLTGQALKWPLVVAVLDRGFIKFDLYPAMYTSAAECMAVGNRVLKESTPEFNYACYDLTADRWPAVTDGYEPK
jgi:hypothetical protein